MLEEAAAATVALSTVRSGSERPSLLRGSPMARISLLLQGGRGGPIGGLLKHARHNGVAEVSREPASCENPMSTPKEREQAGRTAVPLAISPDTNN
jgi:hypothetical protein